MGRMWEFPLNLIILLVSLGSEGSLHTLGVRNSASWANHINRGSFCGESRGMPRLEGESAN